MAARWTATPFLVTTLVIAAGVAAILVGCTHAGAQSPAQKPAQAAQTLTR